jgi:hypothetical protein
VADVQLAVLPASQTQQVPHYVRLLLTVKLLDVFVSPHLYALTGLAVNFYYFTNGRRRAIPQAISANLEVEETTLANLFVHFTSVNNSTHIVTNVDQ